MYFLVCVDHFGSLYIPVRWIVFVFLAFLLSGEVDFVQMICHQLKTSCQYLNICYRISLSLSLSASQSHEVSHEDFLLCQDGKMQMHTTRNINLDSFTSGFTPKILFFSHKVEVSPLYRVISLWKIRFKDWTKWLVKMDFFAV